ncbi:MAG: HAD family hydrolase [Candidatus Nanohaloarchaea archaeon]
MSRQNGIDLSDYRLLIFDMDGTLYSREAESFEESSLGKKVRSSKRKFLEERGMEPGKVLPELRKKYGRETSIGLEEQYGIPRDLYFRKVWGRLKASEHVGNYPENLERRMESLDPEVALLTNAPRQWATKVMEYLEITEQVDAAFYGNRKPKPQIEAFQEVLDSFETFPENAMMIGDEEIDIQPAEKIGMETVLIASSRKGGSSFTGLEEFFEAVKG